LNSVENGVKRYRDIANQALIALRLRQGKDYQMTTSKRVAPKASKELSSKKSTKEEKSVAGSDLSQAKGKKKGK
jgi:hypothetical protein